MERLVFGPGSRAPASTLLNRLMVGGLFLSGGIQKFLFSAQLGSGRFEKIGIPLHEFMGRWSADSSWPADCLLQNENGGFSLLRL